MTLYKRLFLRQFFFVILFFLNTNLEAQSEGEQIFKSNCAACHTIGGGKLIGPDAKEWLASDRFVSTDDPLGTLVKYVQNPADFGVLEMPAQALTAGEIKQVLDYVDGYVPEVKEVVTSIEVSEEESTNPVIFLLIVTLILFLLILVLVSVKNNLKESLSLPTETVFESFKNYVTINRNKIIIGFVLFISLMYLLYNLMMGVGVVEKYQPDQPIAFSHELHAGLNGVDCNYCHSSAKNSAHSGVPSANVCMNCHAVVKGGDDKAKNEIGKIWKSFGLDIETDDFDWNKLDTYQQTPIEWIRVHNLPDHILITQHDSWK